MAYPDARLLFLHDFEHLAFLDSGAFGSVFAGHEPRYGDVALKFSVVRPVALTGDEASEDARRRGSITREVEALTLMMREPHPNIINCHGVLAHDATYAYPPRVYKDAGVDPMEMPQVTCLVFERARCSLLSMVQDLGPLRPALARTYALQIASALAHMHAHDVYHRDLKPDNVLIGYDGSAKIADFGHAATLSRSRMDFLDDGTAAVQTKLGTWVYMPPELVDLPLDNDGDDAMQYNPELYDAYGLGAILFIMITKRHPFNYFASMNREEYHDLEELWFSPDAADRAKYWEIMESKPKSGHLKQDAYRPHRQFIEATMCHDPELRVTPTEASGHPFFARNAEYVPPEVLNGLISERVRYLKERREAKALTANAEAKAFDPFAPLPEHYKVRGGAAYDNASVKAACEGALQRMRDMVEADDEKKPQSPSPEMKSKEGGTRPATPDQFKKAIEKSLAGGTVCPLVY